MTQSDYFPLDYNGERGVRKIFNIKIVLLGSELGEKLFLNIFVGCIFPLAKARLVGIVT